MKTGIALRFLMAQQWAISPGIMEVMGTIAARDLDGIDLKEMGALIPAPVAVSAKRGQINQAGIEMRDGIAIIPVTGVISRYAGMFEQICGGTSTQTLATRITAAVEDSSCRGIILVMDTPGGEANGIHELSEMIYNARGRKPIKAYVSGNGASAGYWLTAACDEVVMDALAFVGSIGTVQSFRFRKEKDESLETLELVSSQSPNKRLDPRTEKGREMYQQALDEMSDVFIERVAKYRGITPEAVMESFGQGWCLMGQKAVAAGMADKLGSLEGLIKEMTKGRTGMTIKTGATLAQDVSLNMSAGMSMDDAVAAVSEAMPGLVEALGGESKAVCMTTDMIAPFLSEQSEEVQAAFAAHFKPEPLTVAMALDSAAEVVALCAGAGISASVSEFLKPGMTMDQVKEKVSMAFGLSDVLAAAGLSGSLASVLAKSDNPAQMVAVAIQEAQAQMVQSDGVDPETPTKSAAGIDYSDIYQARK